MSVISLYPILHRFFYAFFFSRISNSRALYQYRLNFPGSIEHKPIVSNSLQSATSKIFTWFEYKSICVDIYSFTLLGFSGSIGIIIISHICQSGGNSKVILQRPSLFIIGKVHVFIWSARTFSSDVLSGVRVTSIVLDITLPLESSCKLRITLLPGNNEGNDA